MSAFDSAIAETSAGGGGGAAGALLTEAIAP